MLEADTMEDDRREVRLLPLELLSSDMGDMQEDRPGEREGEGRIITREALTGHGADPTVTV